MLHIEIVPGAAEGSSLLKLTDSVFGRIGPGPARLADRRLAGDRRGGLIAHVEGEGA